MIKARDILKKETIDEGDAIKMRNYKNMRNSIRNNLKMRSKITMKLNFTKKAPRLHLYGAVLMTI